MLSAEQVFVLRKIQLGDDFEEESRDLCDELIAQGLVHVRQKAHRTRLLLSRKGRATASVQRFVENGPSWAVACGYFDHLSFHEFLEVLDSPDLDHYIREQARARAVASAQYSRWGRII